MRLLRDFGLVEKNGWIRFMIYELLLGEFVLRIVNSEYLGPRLPIPGRRASRHTPVVNSKASEHTPGASDNKIKSQKVFPGTGFADSDKGC